MEHRQPLAFGWLDELRPYAGKCYLTPLLFVLRFVGFRHHSTPGRIGAAAFKTEKLSNVNNAERSLRCLPPTKLTAS